MALHDVAHLDKGTWHLLVNETADVGLNLLLKFAAQLTRPFTNFARFLRIVLAQTFAFKADHSLILGAYLLLTLSQVSLQLTHLKG